MPFEDHLEKLLSELQQPGMARPAAPKTNPTAAQKRQAPQQAPEFSDARKALRRPLTNLDAAVHQIDQQLNATQKDPSKIPQAVRQTTQSFNALFPPLKTVRAGVQGLKSAADRLNQAGFEVADQGEPSTTGTKPAPAGDESFNKIATDIEMINDPKGKLQAANQGFQEYQKLGGKMNRGEYFRQLAKKLYIGNENQPAESSVQRRKMIQENFNDDPSRTSPYPVWPKQGFDEWHREMEANSCGECGEGRFDEELGVCTSCGAAKPGMHPKTPEGQIPPEIRQDDPRFGNPMESSTQRRKVIKENEIVDRPSDHFPHIQPTPTGDNLCAACGVDKVASPYDHDIQGNCDGCQKPVCGGMDSMSVESNRKDLSAGPDAWSAPFKNVILHFCEDCKPNYCPACGEKVREVSRRVNRYEYLSWKQCDECEWTGDAETDIDETGIDIARGK